MSMKFKERDEPIFTSDIYYDLFDGGYIKPHDLLENQGEAERVEQAIDLIAEFLTAAKDAEVLEDDGE